jgi:hypothetical protein
VAACLLVPNFHNPLGFDHVRRRKKKALVQDDGPAKKSPLSRTTSTANSISGTHARSTLKSMDRKGLVLHCASFSKTLSPGLRVGWTLPGTLRRPGQTVENEQHRRIADTEPAGGGTISENRWPLNVTCAACGPP